MAKQTYILTFEDVEFGKQQEIVMDIRGELYQKAKTEGEEFAKRKEHVGESWQQAYCREYAIDYKNWETDEEAKKFDWNSAILFDLEEKAENIMDIAIKKTPLVIEF